MFWEELVRSKFKKKGKGKKRGDVDEDALSDQERVLLLYYAKQMATSQCQTCLSRIIAEFV